MLAALALSIALTGCPGGSSQTGEREPDDSPRNEEIAPGEAEGPRDSERSAAEDDDPTAPASGWARGAIAEHRGMFYEIRSEGGERYVLEGDELDLGCQYVSPKQGERYTVMSTALFQGLGGGSIALVARLEELPTREEVAQRFRSLPFDCGGRAQDGAWVANVNLLPEGDEQWMSPMSPSGTLDLTSVEIDEVEGDCDAVVTGTFSCELVEGAHDVLVTGAFRGRLGLPE